MYPTRAQLHGRPLPAAAANAPSHKEQSPAKQCLDYAARLSDGRWLGHLTANDLSTHHSKTTEQSHYRKTIGLKQSAGAIVIRKSDYRPIR